MPISARPIKACPWAEPSKILAAGLIWLTTASNDARQVSCAAGIQNAFGQGKPLQSRTGMQQHQLGKKSSSPKF